MKLIKKKQLYLFGVLLLSLLFSSYLVINQTKVTLPTKENSYTMYSNQCRNDLKKTFLSAIKEANKSLFIVTFSLTDPDIITLLNKKADKGVQVTIFTDIKNPKKIKKQLSDSIAYERVKAKGLLHKKILVVDDHKVYLGSANLTSQSLRMHDNLVCGFYSKELAKHVVNTYFDTNQMKNTFYIDGKYGEWWALPNETVALPRIIEIIDKAKSSIKVAMFTWTHQAITDAIIRAHDRGIDVELAIDYQSSKGASKKTFNRLKDLGIKIKRNQGLQLLHHKFAYIDQEILINGSANWTKAAFKKNQEGFFILSGLSTEDIEFLEKLWKMIQVDSQAS